LPRELGSYQLASENYFLINKKEKNLEGWGSCQPLPFCLLSELFKTENDEDLFKWIYFSSWIGA
jgi:hypothetical protein